MPYSYITLGDAQQNLAQRLYDATEQFFAPAELNAYILESLQAFNAYANFQRAEFTFPSRTGITWYDLTDAANLPNTLRAMTTTDTAIVSLIEYHLLEPQTATYPLTWTGSTQFSLPDILAAIQQIRDQLLSESGCTLNESLVAATPGRTFLDQSTMDIRRCCWLPVASPAGWTANCLLPGDNWMAQSFEAGYPQAAGVSPNLFIRSAQPPLAFDVDIQPAVPGDYDLLTTNAGPRLSLSAGTVLPVPNDWAWVIKWGALGVLLSRDTTARDIYRARYCWARYKQGAAALMMAPALLAARINDVPVSVDAVREGDTYRANWQALAPGQPDSVYYAGLNQVALVPGPDAGPYSVTASVVANMPLPANDAAQIQLGMDDLEAVLGEAQHIASFKCGGAEFFDTVALHENFVRHCSLFNSKLDAGSAYRQMLYGRSQEERSVNQVFAGATPETTEKSRG